MLTFYSAFRIAPPCEVTVTGEPPTTLTLTRGGETLLRVELNPAALALTVRAHTKVWHCHRWADATVKPLPSAPAPLTFERGDTYVAVSPPTDSVALARFIHLRDYFNAEKMAEAMWAHALENGLALEAVTVIEVR